MANINIVKGEIGNALTSVAPDHILGVANDIFDENQQIYQQDINTELLGRSDGAFDVSAKYPTSGVEGGNTYTLEGALAVLDANLSADKKKGGMSIKFVQSSDNKYVQFRYMLQYENTTDGNAAFINPDNWEGVADGIIGGSKDLAKSGDVAESISVNLLGLAKKLGTLAVPSDNGTDITDMVVGHYYNRQYQYVTSNSFKCQVIQVDATKIYRIIADNRSWPVGILSLALLDENDNCIGGQNNIIEQTDFIFVGVSKIVLSTIATNNNVIIKVIDNSLNLTQMSAKLIAAETNISKLNAMFDWDKIPMRDIEDITITGNLFKNAKLVGVNRSPSSINTDGTVNSSFLENYNIYIIPVDGVSTYLFTYARFYILMQDETHVINGAVIEQSATSIASSGANYILFSFNTNSYPLSTYKIGIGSLQQDVEYSIPFLKILQSQIKDLIIPTNAIQDNAVTIDKIAFKTVIEGANKLDPNACSVGYINKNTGALVYESSRLATDYIPVSTNGLYCYPTNNYGTVGAAAVYNANKQYLRGFTTAAYTYQEGDAYVRWTIRNDSLNVSYVIEGTQPGTYTPYVAPKKILNIENMPKMDANHIENSAVTSEKISPDASLPAMLPALSLCGKDCVKVSAGSIAAGGSLQTTTFPQYLKGNGIVTFSGKLSTFDDITLGFGDGGTNSIQIKINGTNIYVYKSGSAFGSAIAHGLTISDFIDITFNNALTGASVTVATLSGLFTQKLNEFASLEMYGYPTVQLGSTTAVTDAELRATSPYFSKPIWAFGDSFTSLYDERWTKQLIKTIGVDNFLLDGLAGGSSGQLYSEVTKCLNYGTPKFLIWCLGMNDTYANWNTNYQALKTLCESKGIELILQTIPIPNLETSQQQADINTAIKASGLRYIDACDAMCPNNTWPWYTGYCADGVHPTELGAKVLAARFLSDFPEFMQNT